MKENNCPGLIIKTREEALGITALCFQIFDVKEDTESDVQLSKVVVSVHLATGSTLEPVYIMMKKNTPVK